MNQELTSNPFNPLAPSKSFDEIRVSLASPNVFFHGRSVRSKSLKRSITGRSNPSVMACFVPVSLAQSKTMNVCVGNISG